MKLSLTLVPEVALDPMEIKRSWLKTGTPSDLHFSLSSKYSRRLGVSFGAPDVTKRETVAKLDVRESRNVKLSLKSVREDHET